MDAATLLPPFLPNAAMQGMSCSAQSPKTSSLLSTTLTNPTGTAMTRDGFRPSRIISEMAIRAVGALPETKMASGCTAAPRFMEA